MNAVVESILKEQTDFVMADLKIKHDAIAERARVWMKAKDTVLPVLQAFKIIGAHVWLDALDINVNIAGDKECFIHCWKLWRSVGHRLAPAEKGASAVSERFSIEGVPLCFNFSSTVCKRVQVGTKMVPTPIYETQCGTDLSTLDIPQLEAAPNVIPSSPSDDDIPF